MMMPATMMTSIGLMSGTSADGIDAALLHSDGSNRIDTGACLHLPYPPLIKKTLLREASSGYQEKDSGLNELETRITELHAEAVTALLAQTDYAPAAIDVIGFHGHTISHLPNTSFSWQLGNADMLAQLVGIDVVAMFRQNDLQYGGEGAPLAPLFHHALLQNQPHQQEDPIALVNIGGVANVTVIAAGQIVHAFDTGPGCMLSDDWLRRRGIEQDTDGRIAAQGVVHQSSIEAFLRHAYFARPPPKSLDRYDFGLETLHGLSFEDGAATAAAITAQTIAEGQRWHDTPWRCLIVTGGGRHHRWLIDQLRHVLPNCSVKLAEDIGWSGDDLEAQAFAWLAIRSRCGLPLSLPCTTGATKAVSGGTLFRKK